ncbi:MAG: hypothetical protein ACRD8A_08780 [Candidatus Acidiferrales bacterium]
MIDSQLPMEWLVTAAEESVQEFVLKRLNHAANLKKEAKGIENEAHRLEIAAGVARALLDIRPQLLRMGSLDLRNPQMGADVAKNAAVGQVGHSLPVLDGLIDRRNGNAA